MTVSKGTLPVSSLRPSMDMVTPLRGNAQRRLRENIKRNGIKEPIGVAHRGNGVYDIKDGNHRYGIAIGQSMSHVPVEVHHDEGDVLPHFVTDSLFHDRRES